MNEKQFLERLDILIKEGLELENKSLPVKDYDPLDFDIHHYTKCHSWWLSCLNLLRSFFGAEHHFYKNFEDASRGWALNLSKDVRQRIEYPKEDMARAYAVLSYIKK